MLIEVLISAVIVVIVSGAVFGLLTATAHSSAEERHRSEAYAVAQEDQARLRSLRVPTLNRLSQTKTVTLNGTPFTVESSGVFVNDKTGTSSCGKESSSADYVKITSKVSWPSTGVHAPVTVQSIVAPPTGSLDPSHGTLTIFAANAHEAPIAGVGVSGTGAGTFSGTTDFSGCAMFPDQAAGNYTLTPSGVANGLVDKDGKTPGPITVGVVAGSTSTVNLLYDQPGSILVKFKYRVGSSSTFEPSSADSIVVFNTGMTTAKTFGTPGGVVQTEILANPLFPFTSPDTVYAGACEGNNPNPQGEVNPPGAAAMASVVVPANGSAPATLQLPALNLTVKSGSSNVSGARVTVSDDNCSVSGSPVKRVYSTNTSGNLVNSAGKADPGLPWSTYNVCASASISGTNRRLKTNNVAVQNLTTGTALTMDLSGSGSESSQTCP